MKKKVIIVAGPTASGKSGLALDLATFFGGEIINADSQQVYKDTPIISACPSNADKTKIPHHLYQKYDSKTRGNVVDWLSLCVEKIQEVWAIEKLPIVVGGTGLYINNLIDGTTPIPPIDEDIRNKVAKISNAYELLDDSAKKIIKPNDITRAKRALEVFIQTSTSIVDWHALPLLKTIDADFFVIKILPNKKELDARIDNRFDKMIASGALEEIKHFKSLNINLQLPSAKALGVPELLDYLDGKTTLEQAIELAKTHSHQYAKRQITWFKNKLNADYSFDCCYQSLPDDLIRLIKE